MSDAASKGRPHGAMPQHLRDYWTKGEGAAKVQWGSPDDFYRCRVELGKYLAGSHADVNGLCENLHEIATGMSTAEHAKLLRGKGKDHPTSSAEVHAAKARNRL